MKLTFDILFLTLTMCEKNNQKNQLAVSQLLKQFLKSLEKFLSFEFHLFKKKFKKFV